MFLSFLPQSGFVQQANSAGQKTVGFAPASLILTNYFIASDWGVSSTKHMSLELCELKRSRVGKLLLYINNEQYSDILAILDLYRLKSGIEIGPYSDTKLSSGLNTLITCALEIINSSKGCKQIQQEFLSVLQAAESENKNIIFLAE
ncbi:hypothetical protein [Shewanella livingstonensis]|uniref:Uncharacterized protein n=1 Tax=Shewanella livingstonensis TaxID=150120 RepID=A0A3G8LTR6_9GAMM|nr:hypothetical protein [Shewanella livingstonensis]AZG73016.1 hypothetical protein EGC82_09715 [Shewanella livingstonensis]